MSDPDIRVLPERLQEIAADPGNFLLVAEIDGAVRATALLTLCRDAMYGRQPLAVLENVVVAAEARRSGIGRQILNQAEQLSCEHDCSKVMLLSGAQRPEAHAFFAAMGYADDRKRGFVKYRRQLTAGAASDDRTREGS